MTMWLRDDGRETGTTVAAKQGRRWLRDDGHQTGMTIAQIRWLKDDVDDDGSETVVQGGQWLRLIDDESQCWKRKTI
ncbi:unnamed protein product [Brassica rapa]|uniref:Uncharacterized protein n=2 Tax=Brassica TaxID=3705 RepID=A0A3P5ZVB9_BRACM|nr:unnamed protein product [Brassica napus]CAG7888972.1 unnamed protein product [Brassica rapa]VDC76431.1 unnamed protein product [Brassica rapa]